MNLTRSIALTAAFAAVFALGLYAGGWLNRGRLQRRFAKSKATWQISELSGYRTALVELREGRTSNAVELLEFSVDCLVCTLGMRADEADGASRDRILQTLKVIKAYRDEWPREVRAELLGGGVELTANARSTAEEARKRLAAFEASHSGK